MWFDWEGGGGHWGWTWLPSLILQVPHPRTLQTGLTEGISTANQLRAEDAATISSCSGYYFLTTLPRPPQPLLLSLKGAITPIQSASMGIISRQVWKIALFIMKVIYTCLLAVPDMLPHCHLVEAQGSCLRWFSHFLAFCPSHTSHRHTNTGMQPRHLWWKGKRRRKSDFISDARSDCDIRLSQSNYINGP